MLKDAVGFNEHVNAILTKFRESYVWSDRDKSRIAMYVTDALAGTCESNQAAIAFALREAFIRKARRESSVIAGARFLGVPIPRKKGSNVTVLLRNNDTTSKSIPRKTLFKIGSADFYNPESFILPAKEARSIDLRQGTQGTKTVDLNTIDLDFPEIKLGIPGYGVTSEDMIVYSRNKSSGVKTYYKPLDGTLFEASTPDLIYVDNTDDSGDCSLIFGNGVFGARLPQNGQLVIEYVTTLGSAGNSGSVGQRVSCISDSTLVGITETTIDGGDDQQDPDVIKMYAPYIYEAHKAWVRPDHWIGNIRNYPDVADVVIQSQRDIDPEDPSLMNMVRICVLPKNSSSWGGSNPNPKSAQWSTFIAFVREHVLDNIRIQKYNPEKILTDIDVVVYIFEGESRSTWKDRITSDISEFFRRKPGMLGRKLESSDLEDICKLDSEGVRRSAIDYVRVLSPETAVSPRSSLEYVTPRSINVQVKYTDRKE